MKLGLIGKKHYIAGALFFCLFFIFISQSVLATPYGRGLYGRCQYETCQISLATNGVVELQITPLEGGAYTIVKDEVAAITSSSKGYNLTIESDSETDNTLIGPSVNISPVAANPTTPAQLTANQWGFRIDGLAGFGAGPTEEVVSAPSSSLTFAALPLKNSGAVIRMWPSPAPGPEGDVTEVWYGVRADFDVPEGQYSRTVTYTAVTIP